VVILPPPFEGAFFCPFLLSGKLKAVKIVSISGYKTVPLHLVKKLKIRNITMITVTESALTKLNHLRAEGNRDDSYFVRVGVAGGGCSGLTYVLDFDNQLKADDKVFEDKGVKIVCDKKSFLYLIGTQLEFTDGLNGKGFVFNNPNASRTCGCGESFAV
jgi:iron-sulfur cluster assembly protein